jgi:hypothetical protein
MPENSSEELTEQPNPDENLIRVFDTDQEPEALIVHGLLESAGIESEITSLDATQDVLPGVGGTIIVVREEDSTDAQAIIEDYKHSPAGDAADVAELSTESPDEG